MDNWVSERYFDTEDGWSLQLRCTRNPQRHKPETMPILIVPGYGMNNFIFGFHPRGTSLEAWLAEAGYEVWSVNLRGQGDSRPANNKAGEVSLLAYVRHDLPATIQEVLKASRSTASQLILLGASLGGTIVYAYLALEQSHAIGRVITMGAPLAWEEVHPLLRVAFFWPRLASSVRLNNTRKLVRRAMPLLIRAPQLLSLYMNSDNIDMGCMDEMTKTVEDPHPNINYDIARWIRNGDLILDGQNISHAMRNQNLPLMVVLSNKDGIVPEETALSVCKHWGGKAPEVLRVGDADNWYAHANLFVADDAPQRVFDPIIAWLQR